MDFGKRATTWLALLVFAISAVIYLLTMFPTVPFWDAGEFIAVSNILGIPHPPGTPLYVLLGRVAILIPWRSIAERINALSAIPAALAVMITYLTALKLIRIAQGPERGPAAEWIAQLGAIVGALMFAFSDAFWENAIEAEVYSLMSLAQILVFWLGLRWWEEHERRPTSGPLLLCVYVMWLCVGLHLGVGIMGLPLIVLVWLVDRRAAVVFAMPLLAVLLVTMGLERMAGGVMLLSTVVYVVYWIQKKLNPWVVGAGAVAALIGMAPAFGDQPFNPRTALLAVASVVVPMALLARRHREGRILALALFLMVLGYSTHLYLPIRAAQHPAINEGNPSSWDNLRDLLERKQYGQMNMAVRRAPLSVQLDKEFWRYFSRQWPLFHDEGLRAGLTDLAARNGFLRLLFAGPARLPWASLLPIALGVAGAWWQMRRNRTAFLYTLCFVGLTTAGMIAFLNFSPNEVRERDYFFQSGYHAYSLWIALGIAWMIAWVRGSFAATESRRYATAATATLLGAMPVVMVATLFYTHDRRGNYVAHDYAYNMLAPLAPNSFVFTNGDNDTFPLWYMQQVENFRKDVRVVNLSLLNTDWYIFQLRDEEPKVPIRLDDATIRRLGYGYMADSLGRVRYTNEFMVEHIMDNNRNPDGSWKKTPYFAVTVPEHMGLDPYFSLEGLVYKVNPDSLHPQVDIAATEKALFRTFKYRGLFREDGSWDPKVYKDENAATLSRNYAAAHLQLAFLYRQQGHLDRGVAEMERVARMFPSFTEVYIQLGSFYLDAGDTAKATALFEKLSRDNPGDAEARYYYGVSLLFSHRLDDALRQFENAMQINPDYNSPYFAAYSALRDSGRNERGLTYLERWLAGHPNDEQVRQIIDMERTGANPSAPSHSAPRPPLPGLP